MIIEVVEPTLPQFAVGGEPLVDLPQRLRPEAIETSAGIDSYVDEPRVAQDAEVLRHGGLGHIQRIDELANGPLASTQQLEDAPSVRFSQDFEHSTMISSNGYIPHGLYQQEAEVADSVHTHLMFQNGRAEEALRRYAEIFEGDFTIDQLDTYAENALEPTGQVQFAVCTLLGQRITCIDSPIQHDFDMTPAISLFVECDDNDELERLFTALSEGGVTFMPLDDYGFSRRYG